MKTHDLIEELAADLVPGPSAAAVRRLALGLGLGAAVTMVVLLIWMGRPLRAADGTGIAAFAMKLLFGASMATLSAMLLVMSGRPGQKLGKRLAWLLLPPLAVAAIAAAELAGLPGGARAAAWLGSSWETCVVGVSVLSIPVLLGVAWGFRSLAPTRLRQAGLVAGATSGSTAAMLYALYCPESSAAFLVSWYGLGIIIAGLFGALTGPRLLRW